MSESKAFEAYRAASDQWDEALKAEFGRRALAARCQSRGEGKPGTELRACYDAYKAARRVWRYRRGLRSAHEGDTYDQP